ncbi:hypothetical protein GN956_G22996 [Arapaima gigas]
MNFSVAVTPEGQWMLMIHGKSETSPSPWNRNAESALPERLSLRSFCSVRLRCHEDCRSTRDEGQKMEKWRPSFWSKWVLCL